MNTIIFKDEITTETITDLIDEMDDIINGGDDIILYFNTEGGDYNAGLILIDFINRNHSNIHFIGCEELSSTGFHIFFKVICEKNLLEGVFSVMHLTSVSVETRNIKNNKHFDAFCLSESNRNHELEAQWLKEVGLNASELELITNGDDIYLNDVRLNELLTYNNK